MTATIIDGKATAQTIREELTQKIGEKIKAGHRPPGLAVVIVGENPASQTYVRNKRKAAEAAGFYSVVHELPADAPREELLGLIDRLNADPTIDGILCQFPLPDHLDEQEVTLRIDPDKDVDGFHPINAGRLAIGLPGFVPCTPLGCRELLRRCDIPTEGRQAVIVGRSNIVGTPMALLLSRKAPQGNATVTICHSRTADIKAECRRADILIAAIGKAHFIAADMVKPGAAVIDVGINRIEDASRKSGFRLVGDVDYEAVRETAGAITPVPGGVGPMTIAMLLSNAYEAWEKRIRTPD